MNFTLKTRRILADRRLHADAARQRHAHAP
jgi:hypothetical protein